MWSPLLTAGLGLLDGRPRDVRAVAQQLTHHVVTHTDRYVLWCDADHGFNPYAMAEVNLTNGREADHGAERVLIKRCMTPFQWDTVLTRHLDDKLATTDAALVLALPYDRLFSTDELAPWEQLDYVRYSLRHLRGLAHRHRVPILLGIDLARWRITHTRLARCTGGAFDHRWGVEDRGGRAVVGAVEPETARRGRQTELGDFAGGAAAVHAHRVSEPPGEEV